MLRGLGRLEEAAAPYLESQRVARRLVATDSANQKAYEGLARSHGSLGDLAVARGRLDEAVVEFRAGIEVYQRLFRRNSRNIEVANMLGNAQRRLCQVLHEGRRPWEALDWCLAGEGVLQQVVSTNAANAVVRANLGSAYVITARVYRELANGRGAAHLLDSARTRYRDGLRLLRELDRSDAVPEFAADSVAAELNALGRRG